MVKETVQSLKAENDKLKEKVDTVFGELKQLKESLKQQRPGSHDASNGDEAGTTKSLDFLSKEYDVLVKFRKQAEERISAMEKSSAVTGLSYHLALIILLRQSIKPRNTVILTTSNLLVFRGLSRVKMPLKRHSSV